MVIREDIKKYLHIDSILTFDKNKGFTLLENDGIDEFYKAIANFNEIISHTYIKDGVMLYVINDYLMTFEYKFSEVKRLYDYSVEKELKNIQNYLGDFLLSFQFSLEADIYKKSSIYKEASELFYLSFSRNDFYNDGLYINDSLNYLNDLMALSQTGLDISYYFDNLPKLFQRAKNNVKYHTVFETLLNEEKMLSKLFDFDFDIIKHSDQYNKYIQEGCFNFTVNQYKFESALRLLLKLDKHNVLEAKSYINVLNCLINEINKIIYEFNKGIKNSISFIANIESIVSSFITIKKCQKFREKYENKIEECIKVVLFCKRSYVKSDSINEGMALIKHEFEIEQPVFEKMQKDLSNSLQNVFIYLRVDFDSILESALKSFSDTPLINLVSKVTINAELGTYYSWDKISPTNFSLYYNDEGIKLTESMGSQLTNKYKGDFYLLMLRHISMTSTMAGQILYDRFRNLVDEQLRPYIIDKVLNSNNSAYENDYILCAHLILCIEQLIYDQLAKLKLGFERSKMSSNLENLFQYYVDDKLSRDVYMFVNYILYDEFGLEYRNNFMHGNFVHKEDLSVELLYIFTCVIGLLIVGGKNEKS